LPLRNMLTHEETKFVLEVAEAAASEKYFE
jgi:hypothetical protein